MRFQRLRLNGFKSFVDPTDLQIADGLTGVVGPNGCGKSNLLEALRWVMGENRPTAMRGDGMEDVIFAGAARRPARHFAEVGLQVDNTDRLAPAGFNDSDMLEITRRITRDSGSAYKINGKDVRARDVQMLFADASTGAHSPALVRQGQISELINARPKARRRVLEEAAGISGLYQRRHEAELRLNAADANLARVDDVIEQLAQQLAALGRQARQAARYREIGAQLRTAEAQLLYRRWAEADTAWLAAGEDLSKATRAVSGATAAVLAAARAREGAEAAIPAAREEAAIAGALRQRLIVERDGLSDQEKRAREAIASLRARLAQIARDIAREADLRRDADDTIARIRDESAGLTAADEGHAARLADLSAAAGAAAGDLAGAEGDLQRATEDAARLAARHQSADRLVRDTAATLARARTEADKAAAAAHDAEARLAAGQAEQARTEQAMAKAEAHAVRAETALGAAEGARTDVQSREAEARAARSAAEGEAAGLRAEVQALGALLQRDGESAGQMLDLVRVAEGLETALGAALGEDLRAAAAPDDGASGWHDLAGNDTPAPLPAGVEPLGAHVTAPPALARRLARIGLVPADQGTALQAQLSPGQRLVSREGDLWRWDGLYLDADDAPGAAALRLRQINRLTSLQRTLEEIAARAEGTRRAHEHLQAALAEATQAERTAREARRSADQAQTDASRARARAEGDCALALGRRDAAHLARARFAEECTDAEIRLAEAEAARADLEDQSDAQDRLARMKTRVDTARAAMLAARTTHDAARRDGEARASRLAVITQEARAWADRLATADTRTRDLGQQHDQTAADLTQAERVPDQLAADRARLLEGLGAAEARAAKADDALSAAETALRTAQATERAAEAEAARLREDRARLEAVADAARSARDAITHRIADDAETTPAGLLAGLGTTADAIPDAPRLEDQIAQLRRARDGLGAVNLRAEEDARAVQEEHDSLTRERFDLTEAIRQLRAGIATLNREGRERLLTAFEQVNASFAQLFTHLFGGGAARLVMVESDDPLEAGLEIMCQPPGKKLSTLSLLSGGEQTLTALALIFAVFLANPAPICVLDEVDAPLDDANVTRFCDLLDEMTRRTGTRFLIITHHAVTMARMDRLFGVTMGEQGVSQLVSVDLKKAAQLVA